VGHDEKALRLIGNADLALQQPALGWPNLLRRSLDPDRDPA